MMRVESCLRLLAFGIFASLAGLIISWFLSHPAPDSASVAVGRLDSGKVEPIDALPKDLRDYCAFEEETGRDEGSVKSDKLVLRGLILVHRHGDRSPILPIPDNPGALSACGLSEAAELAEFKAYSAFVGSAAFRDLVTIDGNLRFPRLPSPSSCREGQLTAFGALQLRRLGRALAASYAEFFEGSVETELWSSPYARTFQSALALLVGLFSGSPRPPSLRLLRSPTTHFCRRNSCGCPAMAALRTRFEAERHQKFESSTDTRLKGAVENIASSILGQPSLGDPLALFDTLMGAFACRRRPLPCVQGNCVVPSQLSALLSFHTRRMAEMAVERAGVLPKLAAAEALPILRELVNIGRVIQGEGGSPTKYFRHFSGHDVTLRPLLVSLGLYKGRIPHYAARLVFEAHQLKASGAVLLRVLYNGVDVTASVSVCAGAVETFGGRAFCPLRVLKAAVKDHLFPSVGADDFEGLCKVPK